MNKDYNNVQYILNRSPNELRIWWESLSDDDKDYAIEIITDYRKMLDEPVVEKYTLAKEYLKKFQL
jgi:hypothetical protein